MAKKEILIIPAILIVLIPIIGFLLFYFERIAPGIYIAGINVSSNTPEEAYARVTQSIAIPQDIKITINKEEPETFTIPLSDLNFKYEIEKTISQAYNVGKVNRAVENIATLVSLYSKPTNMNLSYTLDEAKLEEYLSTIAGQTTVEAIYPKITLTNGAISVDPGKKGFDLETTTIKEQIKTRLSQGKSEQITISLVEVDPTLTQEEVVTAQERARKLLDKSITTKFEFETTTINKQELLNLVNPKIGTNQKTIAELVAISGQKYNREAVNPVFVFENSRVKEFTPAKAGIAVKSDEFARQLAEAITKLEASDTKVVEINVPVTETEPKITTSEVNDLGIKELIGRGTSKYRGSIPSRVYNVDLAASRVNGVLVPPGETFSFNQSIGDISKLSGYKEAYVIQNGKTVLGDGGGVCQVSSTLFRAVMNAGLPITERRAHSYRVGYYEQESYVGYDATIYSPTTDFKFKNDTGHHILVQAISDPKNYSLAFEIYGTSDGRVATVGKPVITDVVAPADDLYVDDPTIPAGQVRQVEHRAMGAKSTFNYEVKRGDQVIYQKTFVSAYRPWQAVYLRGTGPAI